MSRWRLELLAGLLLIAACAQLGSRAGQRGAGSGGRGQQLSSRRRLLQAQQQPVLCASSIGSATDDDDVRAVFTEQHGRSDMQLAAKIMVQPVAAARLLQQLQLAGTGVPVHASPSAAAAAWADTLLANITAAASAALGVPAGAMTAGLSSSLSFGLELPAYASSAQAAASCAVAQFLEAATGSYTVMISVSMVVPTTATKAAAAAAMVPADAGGTASNSSSTVPAATPVRMIALASLNGLGDVAHSLAVARALQAQCPALLERGADINATSSCGTALLAQFRSAMMQPQHSVDVDDAALAPQASMDTDETAVSNRLADGEAAGSSAHHNATAEASSASSSDANAGSSSIDGSPAGSGEVPQQRALGHLGGASDELGAGAAADFVADVLLPLEVSLKLTIMLPVSPGHDGDHLARQIQSWLWSPELRALLQQHGLAVAQGTPAHLVTLMSQAAEAWRDGATLEAAAAPHDSSSGLTPQLGGLGSTVGSAMNAAPSAAATAAAAASHGASSRADSGGLTATPAAGVHASQPQPAAAGSAAALPQHGIGAPVQTVLTSVSSTSSQGDDRSSHAALVGAVVGTVVASAAVGASLTGMLVAVRRRRARTVAAHGKPRRHKRPRGTVRGVGKQRQSKYLPTHWTPAAAAAALNLAPMMAPTPPPAAAGQAAAAAAAAAAPPPSPAGASSSQQQQQQLAQLQELPAVLRLGAWAPAVTASQRPASLPLTTAGLPHAVLQLGRGGALRGSLGLRPATGSAPAAPTGGAETAPGSHASTLPHSWSASLANLRAELCSDSVSSAVRVDLLHAQQRPGSASSSGDGSDTGSLAGRRSNGGGSASEATSSDDDGAGSECSTARLSRSQLPSDMAAAGGEAGGSSGGRFVWLGASSSCSSACASAGTCVIAVGPGAGDCSCCGDPAAAAGCAGAAAAGGAKPSPFLTDYDWSTMTRDE